MPARKPDFCNEMKYRHSYRLPGIVMMAIAGIPASQATLEDYDATVLAHQIDQRIFPSVIQDTSIVLDGSAGIPFDFGDLTLSATIEFVLSGELSSETAAVLAVGSNTTWELRFDQHSETGTLGFTHLGVKDYAFDFPSPQDSTHIAYRYDAVQEVMELYIDGELHQLVSAPGYQMPSGQGFLGGRGDSPIATMAGHIERVTTYNTALDPVIIGSHALAFRTSAVDPIAYGNDVSRETRVREESFIGNSVDTATGAFVQHLNLLLVEGGRDLGFSARYNSRLTDTPGALGYGWSHEYEAVIEQDEPSGIATVHWDKNRKNSFRFAANSQPYQPLDEAVRYAELDRQGSKWLVTTIDGSKWEFDAIDGRLLRVANRTNLWLEMVYNGSGRLTEIVEPLGDYRLKLEYNEADLLSRLVDDLGREVFLTYDEQHRLVRYAGPVIRDAALANSSFDEFVVPDNDPTGASGEIDIDLPGFVGLVSLQSATWTHPKPEDLQIWLVSPAGTRALVHDRSPATQANSLILANFDGEPRAGTWRVEAADLASGNAGGRITDFRMRFTEPSNAVNYTYDESHFLTAATDLFGDALYSNTYDERGRVLSQDDGLASIELSAMNWTH